MSEEKTEQPAANTDTGSKPEADNLIERASAIAERLEKANAQAEAAARRMEETASRIMLSGRASAGEPIKTEQELLKENVDKMTAETLKKFGIKR